MDLTDKISADIIRALPDSSLRKLNKLLDDSNASEEQIKAILKDSGINVDAVIKKSTRKEQ